MVYLGKLKNQAHKLADLIWGSWGSSRHDIRAMYIWMRENTRTGHIGSLTEPELDVLIKKLRRMAANKVKKRGYRKQ